MNDKMRIEQVIVVEGKYDAAALTNLVDGLVLTTDGFAIFKDKETQELLKTLGKQRGIILLTDPDAAGFRIRNFLTNLVGEQFVTQAYVPAIEGKESRKPQAGKEGLLGVEGVSSAILRQTLENAGATGKTQRTGRTISYADLYVWGLSGTQGSRTERYAFLAQLGLPPRLSKKALCQVLNSLYTYEEIEQIRTNSQAE